MTGDDRNTATAERGTGVPGPVPDPVPDGAVATLRSRGPALVGREPELAVLRSGLAGALAGRASAFLLAGDAGIGKSRLAGELAAEAVAAGAAVVVGRCLDTGATPLPYLPFSDVLAGLPVDPAALVADRPVLRGLLPGLPAPAGPGGGAEEVTGEPDRMAVFEAVAGALRSASAVTPLLVVLEDLHWADRSSRELLGYLLARLGSQRLLVLGTYRADDLHRGHPLRPALAELVRLPAVRRVELGPLGPRPMFELVRARAAGASAPLPDDVLRRIAERSGGNAFYAEEMVAAGGAGLPGALAEVLLTRLDQLCADARAVTRVAALAERTIPHDLLRDAAGLPEDRFAAGLRDAVSHHVLVPSGEAYAFRHALLRDAVRDDLLPGDRARLHGGLAASLARREGPGIAADLARHALAARDLPRALAASVRAAREAEQRHGPAEALEHAERALELWPSVPEPEAVAGVARSVLTQDAARVAGAAGNPERGVTLGLEAVRVADEHEDHRARADARVRYALRLLDHATAPDRTAEAVEAATTAVDLLAGEPPGADPTWAHATAARALLNADRAEPAWEHARAALAVAGSTDPAGLSAAQRRELAAAHADALITLAFCAQREGDADRARDLLAEAGTLAGASGNRAVELRTVWSRVLSFLEDGLLDAAAAELDEGSARAARYGLSWAGYGLELRLARIQVAFQSGDWDTATRLAASADPAVAVRVAGVLPAAAAQVTVARGDLDAAERLLAELVGHEGPRPIDQLARLLGVVGAEAAHWRGDPGRAARRVREALDGLRRAEPRNLVLVMLGALAAGAHADLAVAARAEGSPDDDERAAAADALGAAEFAAEHGLPRGPGLGPEGRAWLARARAETARAEGADTPESWTPAVETFTGYGDAYRAAEALRRRAAAHLDRATRPGADAHRRATDRRAAAEDLSRAAATAERLGAAPLAAAVADLAARAGVPAGGRTDDEDGAGPSPLTLRERAVLEQVAHGLTNRAIGNRLHISEKTVSVHLSRVMTKLGAAGRAEAVSVAHTRGLLPPHR